MARGDALDRVLTRFPDRRASGDGWFVRCPTHEDKDASLHVSQGRKGAVLKCFAGCDVDGILRAAGLELQDLFDDRGPAAGPPRSANAAPREVVSLRTLAERCGLEAEDLRGLGLRQVRRDVAVPYLDEEGRELFVRRRVKLAGNPKYIHPKGVPLSLYGLDQLPSIRARERPAVIWVEGESDVWVLRRRGFPALGVPGSSSVGSTVREEHIQGLVDMYLIREPDQAGETFERTLAERVRELGYQGPIRVVTLVGAKDPAELHRRNPERFDQTFRAACKAAREWDGKTLEDLVLRMDQVDRKEVRFLWRPYLPQGMVTVVAGKPGLGKSFFVCALAGALTSGTALPGSEEQGEGSVLLFSAEDDPEYVLRGRLEDCGADLGKVYAYNLRDEPFTFGDESFGRLEALIKRLRPTLVVFDPIVSFTGKKVNIYRQNEVRSVLQPLIDIARRTGVSVLLVVHVKKGGNSAAAIDEIMGSVDFSAAARSALIVYPDPEAQPGEQAGVLSHAKHNLSKAGSSLRYAIHDGKFLWRGTSTMNASQLAGATSAHGADRNSVDEAMEFLRQELDHGPRPAQDIQTRATRALGISKQTLARARWRLGVRTDREGFGPGGQYVWKLPEDDPRDDLDKDREAEGSGRAPF